jgi:hypothetical protein
MEQGKAVGKPAFGFPRETFEEFRVGENQIFLLGLDVVQEIKLGVGPLDLSRAACSRSFSKMRGSSRGRRGIHCGKPMRLSRSM